VFDGLIRGGEGGAGFGLGGVEVLVDGWMGGLVVVVVLVLATMKMGRVAKLLGYRAI